jgi:hypothetical protein
MQAGIALLLESSIKRALDIDWNDAVEKTEAIKTFSRQLDSLQSWIERQLPEEIAKPPLKEPVETLVQIHTSAGREALRERTTIEHKLAHISQRQGNDARYVGVRKNTFDLRRASAIQNLETLHLSEAHARKAA